MKNPWDKYILINFIKPHANTLIIIFLLSFIGMAFSFITPILTKSLIDDVLIGGRTDLFNNIVLATAGMYVTSSISGYISSYLRGKLDLHLFRYTAEEAFNSVQYSSLAKSQDIKLGDLISRIMVNSRTAVSIITYVIPELVINTMRIIIPFCIMFFLNSQLALVVIVPVMLFIVSSAFFGKRLQIKQKKTLEMNASTYSFLKENLTIIPLIKAFGIEKWSEGRFSEQMKNYYDVSIDVMKDSSLSSSVGSLIYGVPMVLLIFFGGLMVLQGSLTLGTFSAFMSYVALFFTPISQLSQLWTFFKITSPSFDRINEILQLEEELTGKEKLMVRNGTIELHNVWFSYPGKPILQGFNATFYRGLNYIVGDNGTGKSTILTLLCCLYPVDKGYIRIDGQDIYRVRREDLRKNISLIFSDPYLFEGTIYENIHIGDQSASRDAVVHTAQMVRLHEFVMCLPHGYETNVGENGIKLSSGVKQKIALARAILRDSPILLLDEVTKSIDSESRRSINDFIRSLKEQKTVIIITHNLEEIDKESNIVYLKDENGAKEIHQEPMVVRSSMAFPSFHKTDATNGMREVTRL